MTNILNLFKYNIYKDKLISELTQQVSEICKLVKYVIYL